MYVEEGLVNGSIGTIYDILWEQDVPDLRKTMLAIFLVQYWPKKYSSKQYSGGIQYSTNISMKK